MANRLENDLEFLSALPEPNARRGVTIGELVVVVAIIAVVIAVFLPFSRGVGARHAARRAQCMNNLKQIGLALHNYEQEYGALPPAYTTDADGRPLHSWRTLLLPYLEQSALFKTIDLTKPWNDPANATALAAAPLVYQCPEANPPGNTTTYLAIVGPNACLLPGKPRPVSEITDAREATLAVIEAGDENAVPWMAPVDADEALVLNLGPNSKLHHAGGMNTTTLDGSIHFLKTSTKPEVRRALMTINGSDPQPPSEW